MNASNREIFKPKIMEMLFFFHIKAVSVETVIEILRLVSIMTTSVAVKIKSV